MWPPILVNLFLITLPKVGIAETRAKAIADAMRAYSIAVAPDSSLKKWNSLFITFSYRISISAHIMCTLVSLWTETIIRGR
jgi:hypothetical protein